MRRRTRTQIPIGAPAPAHAITRSPVPLDLPTSAPGDRVIAWVGAVLAAGVSVAVNIGHAWPQGQGFVAFSATLPLLVLITAEQMARRLLGAWTLPVLLIVGVCAYSLSFWHAYLLLGTWHEPWPLCITGAVAVDGLAVGSVVALYRVGAGRVTNGQAAPGSLVIEPALDASGPVDAPKPAPAGASTPVRPAARRDWPDGHPVERPARIATGAASAAPLAADRPSGGRPSTPEPEPAAGERAAIQVARRGGGGGAVQVDGSAFNGRPAAAVSTLPRTRIPEPSTPEPSTPDDDDGVASTLDLETWKLWDTRQAGDGRTYRWLGERLGVSEETARGRARRRKG